MSKKEWKRLVAVAGRLLLAFVFVFSQTTWAGQNQKTKDKADAPQKSAAQRISEKQSSAATTAKAQRNQPQGVESGSAVGEEKSSNPAHQGIKVHGHWTIEVRNPDGTLVTHREFENSLTSSGAIALAGILSRTISVGLWRIDFYGSTNPNFPCIISGSPAPCSVVEPIPGQPPANNPPVFSTLLPTLGTGGTVVLSGSATAGNNGDISLVETSFEQCSPSFAPNAPCSALPVILPGQAPPFNLTQANAGPNNARFTSPIPVQVNQSIAVTVVISFS